MFKCYLCDRSSDLVQFNSLLRIVDEIEDIFKDTVVELFGVDAQSSFIGTRGQKVHCKINT